MQVPVSVRSVTRYGRSGVTGQFNGLAPTSLREFDFMIQGLRFNNYVEFVRYVLDNGHTVRPRGLQTLEVVGTEFSFPANEMFSRPRFNQSLAWAELMMLVTGTYDPGVIKYAAPKADMSLYNPALMYGPRVDGQFPALFEKLRRDPDTREAILVIGNGSDGSTEDQPCTTSIQFLRRFDVVSAVVNMRSQDLIRGLPYDAVMFGGLLQLVALELGCGIGKVLIRHGSAHIYTSDIDLLPVESKVAHYRFLDVNYSFAQTRERMLSALSNFDWLPIPQFIWRADWVVF